MNIKKQELKKLIGGQLLYKVVLVSALRQCASAVCVCVSPPSWASLPHPLAHCSSRHRAPSWPPLWAIHSSFPLVTCFTPGSGYTSVVLSQFVSLSPSLLSVTTSLFYDRPHLCVCLCLTHRLKGKCWTVSRTISSWLFWLHIHVRQNSTRDLFHRRQFSCGLGVGIIWGWFKQY